MRPILCKTINMPETRVTVLVNLDKFKQHRFGPPQPPVPPPAWRFPARAWTSWCHPLWRVLWTWQRSWLGPLASSAAPRWGLLRHNETTFTHQFSTSTAQCLKEPQQNNLINEFYANVLILWACFRPCLWGIFVMYHLCMFILKSLM